MCVLGIILLKYIIWGKIYRVSYYCLCVKAVAISDSPCRYVYASQTVYVISFLFKKKKKNKNKKLKFKDVLEFMFFPGVL